MEMSSVTDIPQLINELYTLIVTYLKEQTLIPLKRVIRYVGMGVIGSLFITVGVLLISLGILRFFQSLSVFEDTYSFAPYILIALIDIVAIGVFFNIMTRDSLIKERSVADEAKKKGR